MTGTTDMPGWMPIMLAPIIGVFSWYVAYEVARPYGPDLADSNYAWAPLVVFYLSALWLAGTVAVVGVRFAIIKATPTMTRTVAWLATVANAIGVLVIHGSSLASIGSDDWPKGPAAVAIFLTAGLVSLTPIAFVWRLNERSSPTSGDVQRAPE